MEFSQWLMIYYFDIRYKSPSSFVYHQITLFLHEGETNLPENSSFIEFQARKREIRSKLPDESVSERVQSDDRRSGWDIVIVCTNVP